jgi:hypothetical protein
MHIVTDVVESSTVHALPNISRNKSWIIKIVWIIFFLVSLGYCSYSIAVSIIEYLDFNVNTQISVIRQPMMEFPTISFCNKNSFKLNELMMYYKQNNDTQFSLMVNQELNSYQTSLDSAFIQNVIINYAVDSLSDELRKKFSFSLEEMLLNCKFNAKNCSYDDFTYFWSVKSGNCYSFNAKKENQSLKYVSLAGITGGLLMELFLGPYSNIYNFSRSSGLLISVHNSSSLPDPGLSGLSIAPGVESMISIEQTFTDKLEEPYSNCIELGSTFDSDLFRKTAKTVKNYDQKTCLTLCYQESLIKNCSCYDRGFTYFNDSSTSLCNISQIVCLSTHIPYFYSSNAILKECFTKCPPECDSINYKLSISQFDFPTPAYTDFILKYHSNKTKFLSYDELKKSVLSVGFYYNEISYTLIKELPSKTLDQMIADLGGILGLYVGASLL